LSQEDGENSVSDRLRSRKAVEKLVEKAKIADAEWIDESQIPAEIEANEETPKAKKKVEKKEESSEPKEKKTRKKV
jgi:hypothetical protein